MSPMLIYSTAVLIISWCVLRIWRRRRIYAFASLCKGPRAWPIIGNAHLFNGNREDLVKMLSHMGNKYRGRRVFLWVFSRPLLLLQTVEDVQAVLNSPHCLTKHENYDLFAVLGGNGLITAPPQIWRPHRKLILPSFTKRTIDSYVPVFAKHSGKFVSELAVHANSRTPVDLQNYLMKFGFRVQYETAMGLDPDKDSDNDLADFIHSAEELKNSVQDAMFNFRCVTFHTRRPSRQDRRNINTLEKFTINVIRAKIEEVKRKNRKVDLSLSLENTEQQDGDCNGLRPPRSFLDLLLDLPENTFNEKECCDEVTTFLGAGSDTTSRTIGFTLLALGMCGEIQTSVHAELDDIFAGRDDQDPVQIADLPNLVYLERVIKETMRMFPAAFNIGRESRGDVKLSEGVTLPAGVGVMVLIQNLHRSPDYWTNPLEFDPDRFLVSDSTKRINPYAYMPFSAGPRNCIGARFAMTVMKVALATLLRTYKFHTVTTAKTLADLRLEMAFVTKPVEGFTVQLSHRNHIDC